MLSRDKRKHDKKLKTDNNTDMLFGHFVESTKFNSELRSQWDQEVDARLDKLGTKLDSRLTEIPSEKLEKGTKRATSSVRERELPTSTEGGSSGSSSDSGSDEFEFAEDSSGSSDSKSASSTRGGGKKSATAPHLSAKNPKSPYAKRIEGPTVVHKSESKPRTETRPKESMPDRPILGDSLLEDPQKYIETSEERRQRGIECYGKLQDMVERYGSQLSKHYTMDSDPDEMQAEYDMLRERRNKQNQVKFYKQILLNVVCGVEFLNEKYDPFEFKLKDWSKQIALDMDDYTEVLEEIYEKYKDRGGKMAPEIRLLMGIVMSGVTFHLSQTLFGSGGLNDTLNNNPNVVGKLLNGLMNGKLGNIGGLGKKDDMEPDGTQSKPNNKSILDALKKHNTRSENIQTTELPTTEASVHNKSRNDKAVDHDRDRFEKEKREFEEMRHRHETMMRRQEEMAQAQIDQMKTQQAQVILQQQKTNQLIEQQNRMREASQNQHQQPQHQQHQQQNQFSQNNMRNTNQSTFTKGFDKLDSPANQVLFTGNTKSAPMSKSTSSVQFGQVTSVSQGNPSIFSSVGKTNQLELDDDMDDMDDMDNMFGSEVKADYSKSKTKKGKSSKRELEEIIETLEDTEDVELSDILEKPKRGKNSLSARKSKSDSASEGISSISKSKRGKNNIIRL